MKNAKHFFIVGMTIIVFIFCLGFSSFVSSKSTDNVSGFGWSANNSPSGGMGWFSANATNDHNPMVAGVQPSSIDYGLNLDTSNKLKGYAWSSNIGWIKFDGLSGFPSVNGTQATSAILDGNNLKGWARACAVFQSGCSGDYYHGAGPINNNLSSNPYLGGWDGWISLSGSGYGVKFDKSTGVFSGYAWGGGDDIGWVDFSGLKIGGISLLLEPSSVVSVQNNGTDSKKVTVTAVLNGGINPNDVTFYFNSINPDLVVKMTGTGLKRIFTISSGGADIGGPYDINVYAKENGTNIQSPVEHIYVNVTDLSVVEGVVTLSNTDVVNNGGVYSTTLSWTTKNINIGSCVASGPGDSWSNWSGLKADSGSQTGVVVRAEAPSEDLYSIECSYGDITDPKFVRSSVRLNTTSRSSTKVVPKYIEN